MSDRLTELRTQIEAKQKQAEAILAKSEYAPGDLEAAEKLTQEVNEIGKLIDDHNAQARKAAELRASISRVGDSLRETNRTLPFDGKAADRHATKIDAGKSEAEKLEANGGFKSLGHFVHALIEQGRDPGRSGGSNDMLRKWADTSAKLATKEARDAEAMGFKAPQGMYESSDPDGGNLVPQDFSRDLYTRTIKATQLLSYLNTMPVSGNSMSIPALKENSRVAGSRYGGIQSYWIGEADEYTKSQPTTRTVDLKLKKLVALTYLTEELKSDSFLGLESWLGMIVPQEINFRINDAVVNGPGGAQPTGILSSGSKITATAVSGQGASTIVAKNILAMYRRVVGSQRDSMIWLYNQEAEAELFSLFQPTGSTSGVLFFAPNTDRGGFTLMGRPALPIEQCAALGTEGDIIAFAPLGYAAISKGGIQSAMSMHVRFTYGEDCLRWMFRFDGKPMDDVALTPANGSATQSSIVTLSSSRT
jgi:HK97 family phage major capsid protein